MCISKVFQNYFTDTFCKNNLKIIETKKTFKIKERNAKFYMWTWNVHKIVTIFEMSVVINMFYNATQQLIIGSKWKVIWLKFTKTKSKRWQDLKWWSMIKENQHTLGHILSGTEQNQNGGEFVLSWMSTSHANITDENGEEKCGLD